MLSSRRKFFFIYWIVYLVFIAIYMYQSKKEAYSNSEKVAATVIDRIGVMGRQRVYYYYPQFQFLYNDSVYVSADKLSWTRDKELGDKLTVIFPKGKPEEAIIYTFVSYWIYLPALLISFMIFFFIFALIVIIKWGEGWSMFR